MKDPPPPSPADSSYSNPPASVNLIVRAMFTVIHASIRSMNLVALRASGEKVHSFMFSAPAEIESMHIYFIKIRLGLEDDIDSMSCKLIRVVLFPPRPKAMYETKVIELLLTYALPWPF